MDESRPRLPIRRFDVFAEYHHLINRRHGMPDDLAKGRAIWAAKVVASRRYGSAPSPRSTGAGSHAESGGGHEEGFRSLGDELQTDKTFDHDIVERMGRDFYERVFQPAIESAVEEGKRYEDIRDSIRKGWK